MPFKHEGESYVMKLKVKLASLTVLLLCAMVGSAALALAQRGAQRDALGFLKRALTEANAPALTADQETHLNTLITNFRSAQPTSPDTALEAARTAYENAILAGDLGTATAQATIIANRAAALSATRLQAEAKFDLDVLTILRNGGQLAPLTQKVGSDHILGLIGSLVGGGPFGGGRGFGPGGGPGDGPGFAPGRGIGKSGNGN